MNAVVAPKRGPLDALIAQILANPQFLTQENLASLKEVVPVDHGSDIELSSLKSVLEKQLRVYEKLQSLALSSNDISENAKVMQASKQLIDLMIRFEAKIDGQSRQIHVENAVVEAFNELGNDELKAKYMKILRRNLAKKD